MKNKIKKIIGLPSLLLLILVGKALGQEPVATDLYNLSKIKSGMHNRRISSSDPEGGNNDRLVNIKPGEKRTIAEISGAGIINHIWITIAPRFDKASRNDIILRMYWDGNPYPSVESPIGPFFGQGWQEQYIFSSLPLAAGPDKGSALVSYFTMPFAKGAKIEIENQTGVELRAFYFYVDYVEMKELPQGMGRFHAWYNHSLTKPAPEPQNATQKGKNTTGADNYVFADVQGKGQFVGVNYYVQNPSSNWYGEGDDMFFVDGEEKPSLLGTGTEDFFNTSWCPKEVYMHPYYGYARVSNEFGWLGRAHAYRFFITDPIYFEKGLKATIEHGTANNLTLDLATVAYWYQDKAVKLPPAPTKEMRKPKPLIGPADVNRWRQSWNEKMGADSTLWGNEK
ncbi:DUF2961 domain-containing protein [Pedobacter sp. BS3]|uniref:glycoside hydrolase family 172 protein n=1 Tax=Pedobacter sp. BS3 TaxID=2567937 RepID=UPI0011EBB288|nr:glycoside hydrolase family 172 protein [Pedobacter sp. BS3]TZF81874.1 DUF2961 domain-containing protein [Pedobacter sp. BS3]